MKAILRYEDGFLEEAKLPNLLDDNPMLCGGRRPMYLRSSTDLPLLPIFSMTEHSVLSDAVLRALEHSPLRLRCIETRDLKLRDSFLQEAEQLYLKLASLHGYPASHPTEMGNQNNAISKAC